jgi:hypothetical protein
MVDAGAGKIQLQSELLLVINGKISFVLMQTMLVLVSVLINTITITTLCVLEVPCIAKHALVHLNVYQHQQVFHV